MPATTTPPPPPPRHASPALGNATRQVHAVFGPVEGGIDVKNGSFSFERTMSLQHRETLRCRTHQRQDPETISLQPYAYSLAAAWRQLLRRPSMHPHLDAQDARLPFIYGSHCFHDELDYCRSSKSLDDDFYRR
ncbi:hypothetical protein M422DRAFT_254715 [Sphaerobolus stellatus SS14]|uniref:Uncharacterized protein n=1 Tax=Sphaerobolus stellatus (strain SS14) TaxID=990650 RepID=A0A0C9V5U3_SPHS4|nr:hypothetical protein M422DRAFT_254715 [Sphaerobolus stellatus SS14]